MAFCHTKTKQTTLDLRAQIGSARAKMEIGQSASVYLQAVAVAACCAAGIVAIDYYGRAFEAGHPDGQGGNLDRSGDNTVTHQLRIHRPDEPQAPITTSTAPKIYRDSPGENV